MSYLNNLRMVFSGKFQSDVSTVNNDVRHFDVAKFKPEYQEYRDAQNLNGWWNPCGSGAFRLIDCQVTEVGYQDGTTTRDPKKDPVIGMLIGGSNDLVSAKMVDLDPQMQMVSEIWGLTMRLTDGKIPGFFEGKFLPAPFRDILFGRQQQHGVGDQTATAIYQSVLDDLSWVNVGHSPFLQQLKAMSEKVGKLSVRMMVYSYNTGHTNPEFTIGRVSGVIGPALEGEPDTFVLGRRFAPKDTREPAEYINFFNAQVSETDASVCVDLSNALPLLNGQGDLADIGPMQLVMLNQSLQEGAKNLSASDFTAIGGLIPYTTPGWINETGALFNVTNLPASLIQAMQSQPLALLNMNDNSIMIRETQDGLLIRAEQVVHRLNPDMSVAVDFYASRYGVPSKGEQIKVKLQRPKSGQGASDEDLGIPVPVINVPPSAITLGANAVTNASGKARYEYSVAGPGNPRKYMDGQVYLMSYAPVGATDYTQHDFDIIANLVFDHYRVPAQPTWNDVKPIMSQYNNLYPVMGRMLVNLSSYASMVRFRSVLELAFSREQNDPNYMPVTRDLSEPKRQMILKWLCEQDSSGKYVLRQGQDEAPLPIEPCASCEISEPQGPVNARLLAEAPEILKGSKELAADLYLRHTNKQD